MTDPQCVGRQTGVDVFDDDVQMRMTGVFPLSHGQRSLPVSLFISFFLDGIFMGLTNHMM